MTTLRTSALLTALAAVLSGCDLGALFVDEAPGLVAATPAPALNIPATSASATATEDEESDGLYPEKGKGLEREPFLTQAEQTSLITGRDVKEKLPVRKRVFTGKATASKGKGKGLDWLTHADMGFIVFGEQNGQRTAIIEGHLLHEGIKVGDYVVTAVGEEGISLREIKGTRTVVKNFARDVKGTLWE